MEWIFKKIKEKINFLKTSRRRTILCLFFITSQNRVFFENFNFTLKLSIAEKFLSDSLVITSPNVHTIVDIKKFFTIFALLIQQSHYLSLIFLLESLCAKGNYAFFDNVIRAARDSSFHKFHLEIV